MMILRNSFTSNKKRSQYGLSLVELMVALIILVLGIMPTMTMIRRMNTGLDKRDNAIKGLVYAHNLMEEIESKNWDEKSGPNAAFVSTPSSVGSDGESSVSDYDDVDDYDGYTIKVDNRYTLTVDVDYVNSDLNSGVTPAGTPTNFKKIEVVVTWYEGGSLYSKSISTIVSNVDGK